MSCENISTGGSISLSAGNLGNFCHTDWQSTYNAFVSNTTVSFSGGATFVADSSPPTAGTDNSPLWLKQDGDNNCAPLGWYYHNGTNWSNPVPVPAEALPTVSPALPATSKGSSTKNAQITVDARGRVTALTEVDPAAESTDGHAKAWGKFTSSGNTVTAVGSYHNIGTVTMSNGPTGGIYTVTTTGVSFSNVCIAIASHPGFGEDEDATGASYTGADHVRVTTSISNGAGQAILKLPRMNLDNTTTNDWDNDYGHSTVSVVFFGN